ncbi:MAG: exodeoxyribonuclease VII small subunit [Rudaea sp.]
MPKKKESFEDLYNELETTVSKLEEGNLSLDESLALYERGLLLARQCGEMLDRAELRLKELVPVNGLARMEEQEDEGDS